VRLGRVEGIRVADDTRPQCSRGCESGESIERGRRVSDKCSGVVLGWVGCAEVLEILPVVKRWRCCC
jgi:hypothetical protein